MNPADQDSVTNGTVNSTLFIETAPLKIIDWLSDFPYYHHYHHTNSPILQKENPLKISFPKPAGSRENSPAAAQSTSGFTIVSSRKTNTQHSHGYTNRPLTSPGLSGTTIAGQGLTGGRKGQGGTSVSTTSNWKELNKHFAVGADGQTLASLVTLIPATNWTLITEIDLAPLAKLLPSSVYTATAAATTSMLGRISGVSLGETLDEKGSVRSFDNKAWHKVSSKMPKLLNFQKRSSLWDGSALPRGHPLVTTSTDSAMGQVFATDAILALLMVSPRSTHPWDLVARIDERGRVFFDARNPAILASALYSVNEGASDAASLHLEERRIRFEEAYHINESFKDQVLKKEAHPLRGFTTGDDGVSEEEDDPSGAVRYRRFPLGNDGLSVVVRTHVDGVLRSASSETPDAFLSLFALNEHSTTQFPNVQSPTGLYSRLDSQRKQKIFNNLLGGAVLGHEMKNNGVKLARWALQALLTGTDLIKIGFVSRVSAHNPPPKGQPRYEIMGILQWKPEDFAMHTANVTMAGALQVLRSIVDRLRVLPAGSYLLHREHAQKPIVRVYELPL